MTKTGPYVIATAAHNEENDLERTIVSVTKQTILPIRWCIVSDGSTDGTDEIIKKYASKYTWINYLRREKSEEEKKRIEKASPGKAMAIKLAYEIIKSINFKYFANLDADVKLTPKYYEMIINEFELDKKLGIGGGAVRCILPNGEIAPGGFFKKSFVGGPVQMFRRECYEEIGGYRPYGHDDCIAGDMAIKKGWKMKNFLHIVVDHYVPDKGYAPTIKSKIPTTFYLGQMHYISREKWWIEIARSLKRMYYKPYILAGASMLCGYLWAAIKKKKKIPRE